jgi:PPK2 family polyphosphate:nucleotide phosphotransferase
MHPDRFRVRHGDRAALRRHPPDYKGPFASKDAALTHLQKGIARLESLQKLLYAEDRYAVLLIFQGMDGAGKDHVIKHVMSGVNPQGTEVHAFKQPSTEELDHDYLWRAAKVLPARGRIGIFNRSYYEEVLVVRVHPRLLAAQKLPPSCVTPHIWKHRFEDINAFEQHLWRNGTIIRKFYLHVSKAEQARRLLDRLDDPAKNWKFSPADLQERRKWNAYRAAYTKAVAATSHHHAPWYVIPADHKWVAQALVADIVVQAIEDLSLSFPKVSAQQRDELAKARRQLLKKKHEGKNGELR